MRELKIDNKMRVPRLEKITINMALQEARDNVKILDSALEELKVIAGQKPVLTRARKAISNFKLRQGMPIGVMVTLRREKMWEFFDRLVNISLPRVRDFRGVSDKAFDGRGNYSLGLKEHTIFPELNLDKVEKVKGLTISITTTARSDFEGLTLLRALGMPMRGAAEREADAAKAAACSGRLMPPRELRSRPRQHRRRRRRQDREHRNSRWRKRACGLRRLANKNSKCANTTAARYAAARVRTIGVSRCAGFACARTHSTANCRA